MVGKPNGDIKKQQLNPTDWSWEQQRQQKENERKKDEAIDDRKTDGPNYPAT